jgi:hypothetical protein
VGLQSDIVAALEAGDEDRAWAFRQEFRDLLVEARHPTLPLPS